MAKSTKSEAMKAWESKTAKHMEDSFTDYVPDNFDPPDLPGDEYEFELSKAVFDVNRNGEPFVRFTFVVVGGEFEGTPVYDRHTISDRGNRTVPLALQILSGNIQRMGYSVKEATGFEGMEKLVQRINSEHRRYRAKFVPDNYDGRLYINEILNGEVETDEEYAEETDEEYAEETPFSEESSEWSEEDWVEVNDPNDEDSPWYGQIKEVLNDEEADVTADADGETYTVRLEYLSEWTDD